MIISKGLEPGVLMEMLAAPRTKRKCERKITFFC